MFDQGVDWVKKDLDGGIGCVSQTVAKAYRSPDPVKAASSNSAQGGGEQGRTAMRAPGTEIQRVFLSWHDAADRVFDEVGSDGGQGWNRTVRA